MRCNKCGTEVENSRSYCPKCGNPLKKVMDYSSLENVLASGVNEIIKNQKQEDNGYIANDNEKKGYNNEKSMPTQKELKQRREIEQLRQKKRKKRRVKITVALVAVIVLILGGFAFWFISNNSYSYQMSRGNSLIDSDNCDGAISHFEKAIEIEANRAEPYEGEGRAYILLGDYDSAIKVLKKGIKVQKSYPKTYATLCRAYSEAESYGEITKLFEDISDKKILNACKDYYVASPKISLEGGQYEEVKKVKLTCATGDTIYYTLDGSEPSKSSKRYKNGVTLDEEGDIILKAVAINDNDIKSAVSKEEYVMNLPIISSPIIKPETGLYTSNIEVSIETEGENVIYYTIDGKDPDRNSMIYTEPFVIDKEFIEEHNLDPSNIMICAIARQKNSKRTSSVTKRVYEFVYME